MFSENESMARVYVETYGCALNKGDTGLIIDVLKSRGHTIVERIEEAEVFIVNTCTVRSETESRMIDRIRALREIAAARRGKLIVAGCMAKAQPYLVTKVAPEASLVSPQNASRIHLAVESPSRTLLLTGERDRDVVAKCLMDRVGLIAIQEGCLGNCSFCIVKNARRKIVSYPLEAVVKATQDLVSLGAVEIELAGQDTGVYGLDIYGKQALPLLIKSIAEVSGDFMIRVGMLNPNTLAPIMDELIDALRHRKVYKFLHIPIQSGSDKVLRAMNRNYTVDEYKSLIKELRSRVPSIAIATDIMVGHPGESNEDFEETLRIVEELDFDRVHIAQYTSRSNTASAALRQVDSKLRKERLRKLSKVVEKVCYKKHEAMVGSVVRAFVTEKSRDSYTARTINYTPLVFKNGSDLRGKWVKVLVKSATFFDLRGEVVS
ncbi:MAG: tRNA (N(6)-L-threonylcarbamoyladenosine(37)-C(2))-methylthiotransferase, partial [Desulfurococcaceae archaeon]